MNFSPVLRLLFLIHCLSQLPKAVLADAVVELASNNARRNRIVLGLTNANDWITRRAVQELLLEGPEATNDWSSFMQWFVKSTSRRIQTDLLLEMARVGEPILPALTNLLTAVPANQANHDLLLCIGRMGPRGRQAIPVLRRQLEDPLCHPETRATIRVVLANIGFESQENIANILASLSAHDRSGSVTVSAISLVCGRDWVSDDIISELVSWLGKPSGESYFAALALGVIGTRAHAATDLLEKLDREAQRDTRSGAYRIALAFARVSVCPERLRLPMRDMLQYLGSKQWLDRSDWTTMELVASRLVDHQIVKELVIMLGDRNIKVRTGAARMLGTIGLPAKEAAPKLLQIAKTTRNAELKIAACDAVSRVADYSFVTALEAIMNAEKSELIKMRIEWSVETIRLESRVP